MGRTATPDGRPRKGVGLSRAFTDATVRPVQEIAEVLPAQSIQRSLPLGRVRAVWLFDVGNQSIRFYGAEMLALVDAAAALVQSSDLDGAAERLRPVPEQQLDTFTSRLGDLRDALRRSRYATSRPAVDMQRQIEEFRSGALGQILSR